MEHIGISKEPASQREVGSFLLVFERKTRYAPQRQLSVPLDLV